MVVDWLNLTVAIVTAVATIMTLGVAKNKISPNVETIKNDLSVTIRRAKTELIYKRLFPEDSLDYASFKDAVILAYGELIKLLPELDNRGNQDEDYYLAEWLHSERQSYDFLRNLTVKEVAHLVWEIRKQKF